jgi:TolB protein
MNADGSHQKQIALLNGFQTMGVVTWSADASRIAFGRSGKQRGIWVMRTDGTQLRRLTRLNDTDPAWSPNGRWIVFDRHTPKPPSNTIWLVPAGGGTAKKLIAGVDDLTPTWSPDGRQIAFGEIGSGETGSLWVMNADGSGAHAILHFNDFMTDRPAWSPDGTEIAYVLTQGSGIYIVDATGNNRRLIPGTHGAREPSWQPLAG